MEERIRTIVADDDPLARRAIKDVLQSAGIVVIAEAASGREAVELAQHYTPDVVVMDAVMPEMDGVEATRQIVVRVPSVKVIVLTASANDDLGMLALRVGAVGYLSKACDVDGLPEKVAAVCRGEAAVNPTLTLKLIESVRTIRLGTSGLRPVRSRLTSREWEVLDLLCAGASTRAIADALVLSIDTVRTHVKNIIRKLGVHSRAEAVAVADQLRAGDATV